MTHKNTLKISRVFASNGKDPLNILLIILVVSGILVYLNELVKINKETISGNSELNSLSITISPPITLTPTPRPLTFSEMDQKHGPCVILPVLMYHHIQSEDFARTKRQTALTVYTDIFKKQMQYLKSKNYVVLTMNNLVSFFDNSQSIPKNSILLTFDDAYDDFYSDAFPVLRDLNFKATVFTPTGLINNPDYLNWDQISEMNNKGILFVNHTWSHKNVGVNPAEMQKEILTADTQLSDRSLNTPKIFAYPYGIDSKQAEKYLSSLSYGAAFSTKQGRILCKRLRFDLPRIRVGNLPLTSYGF